MITYVHSKDYINIVLNYNGETSPLRLQVHLWDGVGKRPPVSHCEWPIPTQGKLLCTFISFPRASERSYSENLSD